RASTICRRPIARYHAAAKMLPVLSDSVNIEIELPLHAPDGSQTKLNTWRYRVHILRSILQRHRAKRLRPFFGGLGILLALPSRGFAFRSSSLVRRLDLCAADCRPRLMPFAFLLGGAG
ncbi:MAG TPA: hypothetical protein VE224_20975, partial [Pseudolabrys sp.]|nr:hypothetical protein [Pseudolabrys sp.]